MSITDEHREQRALLFDAIEETRTAIKAINGPYSLTMVALRAIDELSEIAIDAEFLGRCLDCSSPIWGDDQDGAVATKDGELICEDCATLRAATGDLYAEDDDGDLDDEDADENPEPQENPA
ncbi:hypothetical protein PE067_10440 [Paracoccus sp. DMF-8]|uniref:hypothetical protein n=1 Tax=Paracoccus sp. DMF-8 TaxID=3019445 RepID=UPI0023E85B11|nr:hypothetical protein [Paracoccus sp. DMF-8]MDF3606518.1 hypothetical protein [Paracoccus sp. DMF-8]